jgi:hypothetical protein
MNNIIIVKDKYETEDWYILEKNVSRKSVWVYGTKLIEEEEGLKPIKVFFWKKEHEYKVIWENPYRNRKERRGWFWLTAFNY